MTLASLIYLIDMHNYQKWAQFGVIYGMNAITVYVLADLLGIIFYGLPIGGESLNIHFFNTFTSIGFAPKVASMIYGLLYVGINFIPAFILFRRKIFIKL
jgi:predicted acyltransferase